MFSTGDKLENGHYTVLKELGQGGMGIVYHCHDEILSRDVALKMLLPELMSNQNAMQVFNQEARLAAQLEHPNVVTIFGIGQEERRGKVHHYMVMEYLPGGNLTQQITSKGFPLEHGLNWMKQLAAGLSYAHKRGVVHQDIKSDNVFITLEGDLKIGDFGLARLAANRMRQRITHGMGTPAYMSPEICRGQMQDHRSDIYSLGVLFYEMLVGELPFKARGMIEMAMKHSSAPIPTARKINRSIPEVLDKAIQKMMAKTQEERFQSLAEVLTIIDDLLFELRVARLKPGKVITVQSDLAGQMPAEHSLPTDTIGSERRFQTASQSGQSDLPAEATLLEPGHINKITEPLENFELLWAFHTHGPIGWTSQPVFSKDESTLYAASSDGSLYALSAMTGNKLWMFASAGPIVASPVVMQDRILVASTDGSLYALSSADGHLLWRHETQSAILSTPSVHHNTAFATCLNGSLLSVDVTEGQKLWQYQADDAIVSSAQILQELVVIGSKDHHLHAVSAATGTAVWKFKTGGPIVSSPAVSVNALFAGSQDGELYALDADSGRLMWQYQTNKPIVSRPSIIFTSVVFSSQDRWLYCCEKYDGRLIWKSPIKGRILSGVANSSGSLFASTREGYIYCIGSKTGRERWHLNCGAQMESTPLIGSGKLYVGTIAGDVLAYSVSKRLTDQLA